MGFYLDILSLYVKEDIEFPETTEGLMGLKINPEYEDLLPEYTKEEKEALKISIKRSKKKKDQKELEHEAVVTLKLVQVYVTDKKGNPIMDLELDDFELYDNGKIQKITGFDIERIKGTIIAWLEMEFIPEGLTPKQMKLYEKKIEAWIKDYHRQQ